MNRLKFRCDPALEGRLPAPEPALDALPRWLRRMPGEAFNALVAGTDDTVKRCPPFVDAMTHGFLVPLVCDVVVRDGEFTWDLELPPADAGYPRSPLAVHDPGQVSDSPLFAEDQFLIKFHNFWCIETPPGYALLFTHPVNRFDLPFTTLTGLVDCDRYALTPVHFPARWEQPAFQGVLTRGTPIAQCIPILRETWEGEVGTLNADEQHRARELQHAIRRGRGHYRRRLRAAR